MCLRVCCHNASLSQLLQELIDWAFVKPQPVSNADASAAAQHLLFLFCSVLFCEKHPSFWLVFCLCFVRNDGMDTAVWCLASAVVAAAVSLRSQLLSRRTSLVKCGAASAQSQCEFSVPPAVVGPRLVCATRFYGSTQKDLARLLAFVDRALLYR